MIQFDYSQNRDGVEVITAFIDGEPFIADDTHPNFAEIKAAFLQRASVSFRQWEFTDTDEEVRDMFDLGIKVGQKLEALSERTSYSNGHIYFDGVEVDGAIEQQIIRFIQAGVEDGWESLVRFYDKLQQNKSEHSIQYAYTWLKSQDYTMADDGDIIAYKSVQPDWTSTRSGPAIVNGVYMNGHVPNNVGNVIEMPRDQVVHDPNATCSSGLHAATFDYANGWHNVQGRHVVKLKINPRDIVSVPVGAGGEKMRVCRYVVVEEVTEGVSAPIEYFHGTDYSDLLDDDDWDDDDDGDARWADDEDLAYGDPPIILAADPELERLLAEEEVIDRRAAVDKLEEAVTGFVSAWRAIRRRFLQ